MPGKFTPLGYKEERKCITLQIKCLFEPHLDEDDYAAAHRHIGTPCLCSATISVGFSMVLQPG